MKNVFVKVYSASALFILSVMMMICLALKWHFSMIIITVLASLVISVPPVASLQTLLWIAGKMKLTKTFSWILLFSSIPILASIPACLFANAVPGKTGMLILLGIASGYVGILSHGISIAQLFNHDGYEKE